MIYLDSSVALAHLLAEDRLPPEGLWQQQLVSSRLLEYEVWNRIYARGLEQSHADAVRALIGRVALLERLRQCLRVRWIRFRFRCEHLMLSIWRQLSSCASANSGSNLPATTED